MQLTAIETGVGNLPGAPRLIAKPVEASPGEASASVPEDYAFPDADESQWPAQQSSGLSRLEAVERELAVLTTEIQTLTLAVTSRQDAAEAYMATLAAQMQGIMVACTSLQRG